MMGLEGPYLHEGPYPSSDYCGYEVAYQMLANSLEQGRINKAYTQWGTIRKLRTAFANQVRSTTWTNQNILAMNDVKGKYYRIAQDSCGSLWFNKFNKGLRNRMGEEWRTNKAMTVSLIKEVLQYSEFKIGSAKNNPEKHKWIVFSTYVTITYVISLRGNEGFLLDLEGLVKHWDRTKRDHIYLALLGKFKGETQEENHLVPCACITNSKIPVEKIVGRLIKEKKKFGFVDGPAISTIKGDLMTVREIDEMLVELLVEIYDENKEYFPVDIISEIESDSEDKQLVLEKYYSCYRTFRRSSNSRALENRDQLFDDDIDIVNRWRKTEEARGKRPTQVMRQH